MVNTVIWGCGYVGTRLARRLLDIGAGTTGVVRSSEGCQRLTEVGIPAVRCDLGAGADLACESLCADTDLFVLAPPPDHGRQDPVTRRLVDAFSLLGQPRRILYISTTGVYGDCGGAWVDESWPVQPNTDRSRRRLDAEETLRAWSVSSGRDAIILRVAGVYGPGRLPLERIRQGVPLVEPGESPFTNRIHVDDLVSVCIAAITNGQSGEVYNVSDGEPSTMTQYFLDVADAAGLPHPPLIPMADAAKHLSVGMMSYMAESRRLKNTKLRERLGVTFQYPSLADGLRSLCSVD